MCEGVGAHACGGGGGGGVCVWGEGGRNQSQTLEAVNFSFIVELSNS